MRIRKLLRIIGFFAIIIPFSGPACARHIPSDHTPSPKYLLEGNEAAAVTIGDYIYYPINNGDEYAVALTTSGKEKTEVGSFEEKVNTKDVTGIWRYGFAESKCTSITIPYGISVIDYEAFMGSNITSITIPSSVSQIGEAAFYSAKKMTKVVFTNSNASTSEASSACSCVDEIVSSGEGEIQYSQLALIPSFCFFSCTSLREVLLPQNIEEIGYEAFNGCTELYSTLTFTKITAIRARAFQNCGKLMNVYISSSFFEKENNVPIGIIEEHAFSYCNSNLMFYLVGNNDDVNTWLNLPRNLNKWNAKSDLTDATQESNRYKYKVLTPGAGATYTNDWVYTTDNNGDVTITDYIGPTKVDGVDIKFVTFPDVLPSGSNHKVRAILKAVFVNAVKNKLERVYLPKYLRRIEKDMFDGNYKVLTVVDVNTSCSTDKAYLESHPGDSLIPRIHLNELTELEVIANSAFINMTKYNIITELYLPYSLKAVGMNAFGASNKNMGKVTDFRWYYDDALSALKVIGKEAFYKLGKDGNNKNYIKPNGTKRYNLTTLIIPRTFAHFSFTNDENNLYNLGGRDDSGANAFAYCPLIEKVVFKGSTHSKVTSAAGNANPAADGDTFDLALPKRTFTYNESLRTVVFEERIGHKILFHTDGGNYEPCIGWSAGKDKNDFSGDPALQTLVLPNLYTTIYVQDFAFQGNSRGVIYLSASTATNKFNGTTQTSYTTSRGTPSNSSLAINHNNYAEWQWRTIGNEKNRKNTYPGYMFATAGGEHHQNSFGLDQKMPIYTGVLYEDTIDETYTGSVSVKVGIGNSNEYVVKDKCAFICNSSNNATLANYLYDRYVSDFSGTAKIPATVQKSSGTDCTVVAIGDSAFSAAFCDSTNYNITNANTYKDLTKVYVPSTIASIGDYAFMRAYGITELYAYNASTDVSLGSYTMPTSLTSIGRHAFAFCNIEQFLNIPDTCLFYENSNSSAATASNYVSSVFSNNFSLRKITFGNNSTESTYYKTTTYQHGQGGPYYTSAIYSKDSVTYNASSLLMVLNRDSSDYLSESADLKKVVVQNEDDTNSFNAWYTDSGTTGFLYGAYKMGYWIDALNVGSANLITVNQPLISGIYDFDKGTEKYIYLNDPAYDFVNNTCHLKTISFGTSSSFAVPPYSFEGCETLERIRLPEVVGGTLPAGLFAFLGDDVIFEVPNGLGGIKVCDPGELDLSHTGYIGIEDDAFRNCSVLTTVTAPITSTFTIGKNAFSGCDNLEDVDFTNVTNSVILDGSFKDTSISDGLFNWSSTATVAFKEETFINCSFENNSFTLPAKTVEIGRSCFENTDLATVTASADLSLLEEIGDMAFFLCGSLNNFVFSKFNALTRIGHYAFGMRKKKTDNVITPDNNGVTYTIASPAKLTSTGQVELPATLTNLGVGAFFATKITSVKIQSSHILFERGKDDNPIVETSFNRGGHQFRYCSELVTVFFSNKNCVWDGIYITTNKQDQCSYFSNCPKLEDIYLPRGVDGDQTNNPGYTLNNPSGDSIVYDTTKDLLYVYTYYTYAYVKQNSINVTAQWRKQAQNVYAPLVYFVETSADMLDANNNYYDSTLTVEFWGIYNNNVVKLGAPIDKSGTNVSFSNGYTLGASGISHS